MTTLNATFEVTSWDEQPFDERAGLAKLTRASVAKSYSGDVDGSSATEWLMAYSPTPARPSSGWNGSPEVSVVTAARWCFGTSVTTPTAWRRPSWQWCPGPTSSPTSPGTARWSPTRAVG